MLRETKLTAQALSIATRTPISASTRIGRRELLALFREKGVRQIPLLDDDDRPTALAVAADVAGAVRSESVVIMAGGRGTRLGTLTAETPKPMIDVGGRPILETIIDQLVSDGFATILLAVNYQAARIQAHFGDGERFGARIDYLCEQEPLGTAGALRLLADRLTATFLVVNADLLTSASFAELADAHRSRGNDLTLGVSDVDIELRYGVVDVDSEGRVTGLREKPKVKVTANAGMYVVEPGVLPLMASGPSTMPELVTRALERGLRVGSYPMRGLWLDIGELADLQRAHAVYEHLVIGRPT
jgi:NDP-sugar pyrophosphorylase family protein